ncbi:hypothetical protein SPBR_07326 [Sporothrix brasiliensis 5110]|uniref:Endosomal spry domain-containing protein n=1 Tax=Sporothrix brasiliensis 5110 TaxID=1398154 RepID=A0A0C2FBK2_9PEZI|nr:uncharacterized protein SPBR_07326 [Sporothrix brasiliensis 5110]KIH88468.1 hypothetical protein SPBR_07326 [Sporothrix brasiliensis 5110]
MAPTVFRGLVSRLSTSRNAVSSTKVFDHGPLAARAILLARDAATTTPDPHVGVTAPQSINNNAIFALFGILGAAICVAMIWFFFWAKNGGFHFTNNDWEDYKTTVLRRRGPNGTILSNATPSTDLGGGSIYKDVDDNSTEDASTVITGVTGITESTAMSGITAGVSDIMGREKRRKKKEHRDREKERRREEKHNEKLRKKNDGKSRSSRKVNEDGVVDEMAEANAQAHLRDYRHEKVARVGGINKASDSSQWDGSNPSASSAATESTVTSELISNREHTPTNTPTKKGIRKVYSTADRNAAREQERVRAEGRRLQERGQRASHSYAASAAASSNRRDFSWQYGEDASTPLRQIDEGEGTQAGGDGRSQVPGAWTDAGQSESDLGTKSYRHVIPGLSAPSAYSGSSSVVSETQDFAYAEEKRKRRQERNGGYRRG